jgi:hypothetical protein
MVAGVTPLIISSPYVGYDSRSMVPGRSFPAKDFKAKGKRLSATTEKPIHLGSDESPFKQALA